VLDNNPVRAGAQLFSDGGQFLHAAKGSNPRCRFQVGQFYSGANSFQADGLRLLQRQPLEDIAQALRAALAFPARDTVPLLDLGDGYTFLIARVTAEELYHLSFAADAPRGVLQRESISEAGARSAWSADVLPIGFGITAYFRP
jgi:hypothetical protein